MRSKLEKMVFELANNFNVVSPENIKRLQHDLEACIVQLQQFTQNGVDRCELRWECAGHKQYPTHRMQAPVPDCMCGVCRIVRWDREEVRT